jgi:MFS family permease
MTGRTELTTSKKAPAWELANTAPDQRRWWALAATSLGLFMAMIDINVVNVALPTIGNELKASFAGLQWTVNAYVLALAVLFVTAGRLGDIFGRKRVFILGLGLFSLGSLLCAFASGIRIGRVEPIALLIGARALQGLGGSTMLPPFTGRSGALQSASTAA